MLISCPFLLCSDTSIIRLFLLVKRFYVIKLVILISLVLYQLGMVSGFCIPENYKKSWQIIATSMVFSLPFYLIRLFFFSSMAPNSSSSCKRLFASEVR